MNKGKLYLIPTIIGQGKQQETLPSTIKRKIEEINIFIVENIRTARRHIRKIVKDKDIDNTTFYYNGKHQNLNIEECLLPHILSGQDIGILSEAGCPCIADPGSKIVEYAHNFQIDVIPLVGPSSILLALISSGMNGQNFTFNGYLPVDKTERKKNIKQLERLMQKTGQTQIFMETPYRNNQLIEAILKTCDNTTKLCIASDLTLNTENIKSQTIAEWKKTKINIHKKPTIFLIG